MGEEVKRPLEVKLITVSLLIQAFLIIIIRLMGGFGIIGILFFIALYYGLWKMKKDWMYLLIFGMSISIIISFYSFFVEIVGGLGIFSVIDLAIGLVNLLSIAWLFSNRNLFTQSKGSGLGSKKEWMIILIVLAALVLLVLLFIYL